MSNDAMVGPRLVSLVASSPVRQECRKSRQRWLVIVGLWAAVAGCSRPADRGDKFERTEIVNSLGMILTWAPAGQFLMGSDESDAVARGDGPQHEVRLTHGFWIGKYEVTQTEYQQVMGENPSRFYASGEGAAAVEGVDTSHLPVDRVTWEEAVEFCRRLSALPAEREAGRLYRLPTDAEWEYACRAGGAEDATHARNLTTERANISAPSSSGLPSPGRTVAVGSYPPNAWGLFDMHGNVWEWCQDGRRTYSRSAVVDPRGPDALEAVLRGGGWDYPADYARNEHRQLTLKGYVYFGFRVVCVTAGRSDEVEAKHAL